MLPSDSAPAGRRETSDTESRRHTHANAQAETASNPPARTDTTPPTLLNEGEAAEFLRVKKSTVRNERIRQKLGYTRIGHRIFYRPEQLRQYIERQSVSAWVSNPPNDLDKSAPIGSAKSRAKIVTTRLGTERGTTPALDKHAVSALARKIFKRPESAS